MGNFLESLCCDLRDDANDFYIRFVFSLCRRLQKDRFLTIRRPGEKNTEQNFLKVKKVARNVDDNLAQLLVKNPWFTTFSIVGLFHL